MVSASRMPWHPGRCAQVRLDGVEFGHAGELHPHACAAFGLPARSAAVEIDLDFLMTRAVDVVPGPEFSSFPVAKEDVALVVSDDVTVAQVEAALLEGAGDSLESIRLFDVYTGDQVERRPQVAGLRAAVPRPRPHPDRAGDRRRPRRGGGPGRRTLRSGATLTPVDLRLLDEVSWRGTPLPGGRTQALLAALVTAGGQVSEERLVDEVWGPDDVPANPAKALQVVVSRARAQTGPEVVTRTEHGYRLGLADGEVDALVLRDAVVGAREAEGRRDLIRARDLARQALAQAVPGSAAEGPLGELRLTAARHHADRDDGARPSAVRARRPPGGTAAPRAGGGRRGVRRRTAALHGRGARRPGGAGALRAAPRAARRPARCRSGTRTAGGVRRPAGRRTARSARGCSSSRRRWSVATRTSGRCGRRSGRRG